MHVWRIATALLLVAPLLSGCMAPGSPSFTRDWESERAAHGPMGLEATMDLQATGFAVTGEGRQTGSAQAPFTLHPDSRFDDPPWVFFDATLADGRQGILLLEGEAIAVPDGTVADLVVTEATGDGTHLALRLGKDGDDHMLRKPEVTFPESMDEERSAYFFADFAPMAARGWQVAEAARAVLVTDGASEDVALPVRFDADAIIWDRDSTIKTTKALSAQYLDFTFGGAVTDGALAGPDVPDHDDLEAVFGKDAALVIGPAAVASTGMFRLTQFIADGDYMLDAKVQVRPAESEVTVFRGEEDWFQVAYREHSYVGAAVFEDLRITGDGAGYVDVPLARPPLLIQQMLDLVDETDPVWAKPWVALTVVLASPAILFADAMKAIACALTFCPTDHPYPVWMDPGEIGDFYYRIDARGAPVGEYEAQVTMEGANHEPVTWDIRFSVVERPEEA